MLRFLHDTYVPLRLEIKPDSVRQMESTIRAYAAWLGREPTVDDLTEDSLRRFLTAYKTGRSGATVNSRRTHLLAIWRCAWDEGRLPAPPRASKVPKAKPPTIIPEAWSPAEVGRILASARNQPGEIEGIPACDWWESLLLVFYDTGERKSAVLRTRPGDLDLDQCWVLFPDTKGDRPRLCPIHSDTVAACRKVCDRSRDRVWPWPHSGEWLDQRFRFLLDTARVAYGRGRGGLFHKLRRTSGTLVEANGGDGAKHIGDTRRVFETHYLDPRFSTLQGLHYLPRPA